MPATANRRTVHWTVWPSPSAQRSESGPQNIPRTSRPGVFWSAKRPVARQNDNCCVDKNRKVEMCDVFDEKVKIIIMYKRIKTTHKTKKTCLCPWLTSGAFQAQLLQNKLHQQLTSLHLFSPWRCGANQHWSHDLRIEVHLPQKRSPLLSSLSSKISIFQQMVIFNSTTSTPAQLGVQTSPRLETARWGAAPRPRLQKS